MLGAHPAEALAQLLGEKSRLRKATKRLSLFS